VQCLRLLMGAFFIVAYAFDRARAHSPKIVGPSLTLLLFVDVSPSSEFRRWPTKTAVWECTGVGKIGDFRLKSLSMSEIVRDGQWLLGNVNRKS